MIKAKINPELSRGSVSETTNDIIHPRIRGSLLKRIAKHWQMIVVIMIPIAAMLTLSSINLDWAIRLKKTADKTIMEINDAQLFSNLIKMLQRERGRSATYISVTGNKSEAYDAMVSARSDTDAVFLTTPLEVKSYIINGKMYYKSNIHMAIQNMRQRILTGNASVGENLDFYTNINNAIINRMLTGVTVPEVDSLFQDLVAYTAVIRWMDLIGLQRALVGYLYTTCDFNSEKRQMYLNNKAKADTYQEITFTYGPSLQIQYEKRNQSIDEYLESVYQSLWTEEFVSYCQNLSQDDRLMSSLRWFKNISIYIDFVFTIQTNLSTGITNKLINTVDSAEFQMILYINLQVVVTCLSFGILLWYLPRIDKISLEMSKYDVIKSKTKELARKKELTEKLLHLMLPKKIAMELVTFGKVSAEEFKGATIYFSDIVQFTVLAANYKPMQIVDLLNDLYNLFDNCIERYDVYKVETIGDAYMVCSGIPTPNGDVHASEISQMALEIRDSMTTFRPSFATTDVIQIRIGINTGPCVAGIVGRKMPRYCLFGDTVNTASRMESSGEGGRIQISESTFCILSRTDNFVTEKRGLTDIKGKGFLMTYWLEGIKVV